MSIKRSPLTHNTNDSYIDSLGAELTAEPLSSARLAWFSGRLRALRDFLTARYPGRLRVRGMHLTPQWYNYPWVFESVRIRQIQRATADVVGDDPLQGGLSGWESVIESKGEWLDHIHPGPIPASWIWADMALNGQSRRPLPGHLVRRADSLLSHFQTSSASSPRVEFEQPLSQIR